MISHESTCPGYTVNLTRTFLLLAALLPVPIALNAQGTSGGVASGPLVGFGPTAAALQRRLEAEAIATPAPARARAHSQALSKEPHVAGTPAQARTRDYVIEQMKAMGLETEIRTYDVWLPHATSVKVTRMGRDTAVL